MDKTDKWITSGYDAYLKRTKKGFCKKSFMAFLGGVLHDEMSFTEIVKELYWQTIILAYGLQGAIQLIEDKKVDQMQKRAEEIVKKYRPKKKGKKK